MFDFMRNAFFAAVGTICIAFAFAVIIGIVVGVIKCARGGGKDGKH